MENKSFSDYLKDLSSTTIPTYNIPYTACNDMYDLFDSAISSNYGFIKANDRIFFQKHLSNDGSYTILDTNNANILKFSDQWLKVLYYLIKKINYIFNITTYKREEERSIYLERLISEFENSIFTITRNSGGLTINYPGNIPYKIITQSNGLTKDLVNLFNKKYHSL